VEVLSGAEVLCVVVVLLLAFPHLPLMVVVLWEEVLWGAVLLGEVLQVAFPRLPLLVVVPCVEVLCGVASPLLL